MTVEKETPEIIETPTEEVSVETLQARITETEKERDNAIKERDERDKGLRTAHQTLTQKDKELKDAQNFRGVIKEIQGRQDTVEAILKASDQPDDYDGEESPTKKRKSVEETLVDIDRKRYKERYETLAIDATEKANEAGLDIEKSPELKLALRMFKKYGDAEGGYEEVMRVISSLPPKEEEIPPVKEEAKPTETPEAMEKRLREEVTRKIMEERGEITPEGTIASTENLADDEYIKSVGEGGKLDMKRGKQVLDKLIQGG